MMIKIHFVTKEIYAIMENLKQPKKVFSYLGFCYLIGTVALYVLRIVLSALFTRYWPDMLGNMNFNLILSSIMVYAIAMPLILLLASRMEKDVVEHHKMSAGQFVIAFIICYALVYASNLIGNMITMFIGILKGSAVQNGLIDYVTGGNPLVNFLAMVVIAPIVEEYVFRKVIVDRTVRYGQGIAIITSGLMFGLFHGNLNQFAYAVVLGMFFAFLYVKTGNLKITIAMHAIVNFMGSIVAGQLMKMLDYGKLMEAATDQELMTQYLTDHMGAIILFGVYLLFLLAAVITGFVLFIIAIVKKRFSLAPGRTPLPQGTGFSVLMLNPGMMIFCVVYIVLIVLQLLS